ncbi:MAG: cytochrome b/b6 domain-containing protein [Devosiaceae bacterium]|nr:cytochrome b/b6 domain-containing protein [Devosiaceae bacterium MH13]
MTRYSPLLVALHWLMAVFVPMSLIMGGFVLSNIPLDAPDKPDALASHMTFGVIIGVLLVLRLIVRLRTPKPAPAESGNAALDGAARFVHVAFYVLIAAMVAAGLMMAFSYGLIDIVFNGAEGPIPQELRASPFHLAHKVFGFALLGLIVLHVAAALYHTFSLKDGLMKRMWFGR